MARKSEELYEFGEFRLNVSERKIERLDGDPVGYLPEKAFQTLVHLVRNGGALVEKDELLSHVWHGTVVEENNLGKAIYLIRQVLREGAGDLKYIQTVPKHGYRFMANVTRACDITTNGDARTATEQLTTQIRSPAYDLYLRGKVKANSENLEDTEAAIKVLEAAVAIDPELAGAYAQLARAYNTLAFKFSSSAKAKVYHENAEVAILKALALDPDLAEAHFARGLILWTKSKGFPHEQAIRSYQRSLQFDDLADETHHQLSMVYSHVGLIEEAQASISRTLELNPNNTMARFRVGVYLGYEGKFGEALIAFKLIPRDVSPMLVDRCYADVLVQLGRLREAESIVDKYLGISPTDEGGSLTSVKACILARRELHDKAENAIARAAKIGRGFGHFHHTAHNIASAYAAMNRYDEAVDWLENAADSGFPNYTYFKMIQVWTRSVDTRGSST